MKHQVAWTLVRVSLIPGSHEKENATKLKIVPRTDTGVLAKKAKAWRINVRLGKSAKWLRNFGRRSACSGI